VTIQPVPTSVLASTPALSDRSSSALPQDSSAVQAQKSRSDAASLPPTTPGTVGVNSDDEGGQGDAAAAHSSRKRRRLERERKAIARATDQGVARVEKLLAHQEKLR